MATPVVTVAQMRAIDTAAIRGDTAVGWGYMRRAAEGLAREARGLLPSAGRAAVVCGKGNNGGDGYAAGALLYHAGFRVVAMGLCGRDELAGEALAAFDECARAGAEIRRVKGAADLRDLGQFDLVIDAVLGSGLSGNPSGLAAAAIEAMNACGKPVVAADTPSGLDCDTGTPGSPCVRAALTVTMGFAKLGQLFHPGRACVGRLVVQDLSYPADIVARHAGRVYRPTAADLRPLLPPRRPGGSKFDHGVVVMAAGSRGMLGSATLASTAALRSGCGMVHAAVASGILDVLAAKVTEVVLHAMPQTRAGSLSATAHDGIARLAERAQCACIGPGLSHDPSTLRLVRRLVATLACPVVLDADGINAYKGCGAELADHRAPLAITPHAGEWERLFGAMPPRPAEMVEQLRRRASECRMTVLFKGSPTVVAVPDGDVYVLDVGNSGLATAGSGDVLTGLIAGLAAQGAALEHAALLGCWLHGRSADLAAAGLTEYCLIASDLLAHLPGAFRELPGQPAPAA